MKASPLRIMGIVLAPLALGSCSYSYDLLAVVIGGRLAFIVDPSSSKEPECINGIMVSTDKGETATAKASSGDDEKLVANGAFWWKVLESDCQNPFPIFYGQTLNGDRLTYLKYEEGVGGHAREASPIVGAKPLHVGVVYQVTTTSGATGYGGGWFRITPDRRVENWSNDPTPAVTNEQGYDVSGPYDPPPSPSR